MRLTHAAPEPQSTQHAYHSYMPDGLQVVVMTRQW